MPGECGFDEIDCGNGYCCPSDGTCSGMGSCEVQSCESWQNDCGDGYCCESGAECVGGGQCEEPGCEDGLVDCGDYCCQSGDQCGSGGQCEKQGCEDFELDCGGGVCCPSYMRCAGGGCEPIEEEDPGSAGTSGGGGVSGGGISTGACDEATIRAAIGSFSSGNACVDNCVNEAIACAGRNGCTLTNDCANTETSCVTACFQ
jgi:hypothetical protein